MGCKRLAILPLLTAFALIFAVTALGPHHYSPQFSHIPHHEPSQLDFQALNPLLSDNFGDYSNRYKIDRICKDYCSFRFLNMPVSGWNKKCTGDKSCNPNSPYQYLTACHNQQPYQLLDLKPTPRNFSLRIKKYKKCMKTCKKYS
ncbi:hypothetical protein ACTXT7_017577, partial [Hymenolepis weldensis]